MPATLPPLAFATGSRVYGTPTETSDLDLVIRVSDSATVALIAALADSSTLAPNDGQRPASAVGLPNASFRFGKLNIIIAHTDRQYADWKEGTAKLMEEKPVTRERAVEVFTALRARVIEQDDPDVIPW